MLKIEESAMGKLFGAIYRHHPMIVALALRDLRSRYAGTLGGILWTVLHPLAVISIFYFVFAIGFKSQGPGGTPLTLWFVCGLIPWFFFNETLLSITDSVTRHAHLVKKTVFPSEILPLVHLASGLVPHAIFMLILASMLAAHDVQFMVKRLLIVYFLICACTFLLGLGWLLAALHVFYRDISNALAIVLNLWFWATPIVWPAENVPAEYRALLFCNPVYYIVEGYRGLLLFDTVVWPSAWHTIYFWTVAGLTLLAGVYVFNRLKPEFADVM